MPNETKNQNNNLMEVVTQITTFNEFVSIVEGMISPEDKKVLGEDAAIKVTNGLAYLGAFSPAPSTLDKAAFLSTAGSEISENEGEQLWQIANRLGILKEEPQVGHGRVSVSEEFVQMALTNLLTLD